MPMILESQTARELAAKSHEARRRNKELREQAERDEAQQTQTPQPITQLAINPLPDILTRTREHLEAIDKCLEDCVDPKSWDALTRSREREWRIYAHVCGIPGPGNLKPSNKPQSQRRAMPEPIPCGPEHTISSGLAASSEPISPKSLEPQQ